MSYFIDFVNKRNERRTELPARTIQQPVTVPEVDTSDVVGSLAGILGPTPEERAEQENKLLQHRRKMHGWTALFNGLRHLGNLYFTAKGAQPQKYGAPHALIEQQYQDERKRLEDASTASQRYYANLWNLRRQVNDERRRDIMTEAQAKYYDTRDEVAAMKAENDRLKNEKYIELQDGRIAKLDAETNRIQEMIPLQKKEIESRIGKNNRTGGKNNETYGYITTRHVDYDTGDVITERVPTTGNVPMRTVVTGANGKKKTGINWNGKKKTGINWK